MIIISLLVMCVVFVELFVALGLRRHVDVTLVESRRSLDVVRSKTLSDDEKEQATRRSSATLIRQSGLFFGKLLVIMAALALIVLATVHLAGVDAEVMHQRLLSPLVWLAMTAAAALYVGIRHAVTKRL